MATRNPANEIKFGYQVKDVTDPLGYGAPVTLFTVSGATGVEAQVAPGEDMEAFVELVSGRGTIVGLTEVTGGDEFGVYVENADWDVADLEAAVVALGGVFGGASVA